MDPADLDPRDSWNAGADAYVHFVDSGADYYRHLVHGPALLQACGDVRGLRVLDVGCGHGYFCRQLAAGGAVVTGVDLSDELIAAAVARDWSWFARPWFAARPCCSHDRGYAAPLRSGDRLRGHLGLARTSARAFTRHDRAAQEQLSPPDSPRLPPLQRSGEAGGPRWALPAQGLGQLHVIRRLGEE